MSACEALAAPIVTPPTPTTTIITSVTALATPHSPSHSRSCSPPNANDTDSGKSSCSPALLDCSFDSGISVVVGGGSGSGHGSVVEVNNMELQRKIIDYQRLLVTIERDRELYRLLRERLSQIINKKNKKQSQEEICCNICCTELDANDAKSAVQCSVCRKTICRGVKCADWVPATAQFECQLCHNSKESLAQTSSWVAEQMSFNQHKFVYPVRARSEIYIPISDHNDSSMHFESVSQVGGFTAPPANSAVGSAAISAEQKLKIREYVEEVVAKMLGGSLDQVAVGQLSRSENYLPSLVNGHTNPNNNNNNINSTSFTDVSQTRLRQLIETIIAETLRQPALSSAAVSEVAFDTHSHGGSAHTLPNGDLKRHRTEHYFEPKIYQDLLATAVLNKIADTHGNARHLSESSPDLTAPDGNKTYKENQSTSSSSSIEPRSDCSFTDTDQILNISKGADFSPCGSHSNLNADVLTNLQLDVGRESALSDYIASHMVPLPDLSAPATESEEDDYASISSSQVGDGNWENNWLFKKKRASLGSTVTAGSIGMLVPAPKEDVRAQIGDKLADEISDLSEAGSDTDDSSLDILRGGQLDPLNDRLLNKHLIGGQNTKMVLDELIDRASMISSTSLAENEPIYTETKNENVIKPMAKTEAINTTVTQSLLQISPPSTDTMMEPCDPVVLPPPCTFGDGTNGHDETASNPITSSIAEREYKKWNNAVDMPNNPYAPEALKRRISGSQERFIDLPNISPSTEQNPITLMKNASTDELDAGEHSPERDYKRYSRDYYINDTKSSTTTSIKSSTSAFNDSLITSQDSADITINEAKIANATATTTSPSDHVFQALPAQVVEDPDPASLETLSTQSNPSVRSVQSPTTTSDDSDTIRIYDFKKQATTVIRDPKTAPNPTSTAHPLTAALTESTSIESNVQDSPKHVPRKDRPKDLAIFAGNGNGSADSAATVTSPFTPTRGSTPTAFKFLQPKRKLIDPSQVLSFDEDYEPPTTPPERKPIEDEVAQALPSVKALAKAFLMTSHKNPKIEQRVPVKVRSTPDPLTSSPPAKKLQPSPITIDLAEDATIASDLSSLETDPPTQNENKDSIVAGAPSPVSGKTSPAPLRTGVLRSKLAFFENLKFK